MVFRKGDDVKIKVHQKSIEAYKLLSEFLSNTKDSIDFYLEPNQTLIMDNTRILHGRTGFDRASERKLVGLWLDGKSKFSDQIKFGFSTT